MHQLGEIMGNTSSCEVSCIFLQSRRVSDRERAVWTGQRPEGLTEVQLPGNFCGEVRHFVLQHRITDCTESKPIPTGSPFYWIGACDALINVQCRLLPCISTYYLHVSNRDLQRSSDGRVSVAVEDAWLMCTQNALRRRTF